MDAFVCCACDQTKFVRHWKILSKCVSCGMISADPRHHHNTRRLYKGHYFQGGEYRDYLKDEPLFMKNFEARLKHVLKHLTGGRLLEIGSAFGFFLALAKAHFEVVGFEPNQNAAEYARHRFAVDVRTADFLDTTPNQLGGWFDVAVLWDVIEHLEKPHYFIQHISDISKPGAYLFLTTGDVNSLVARLRKERWRLVHPPTHLHYFGKTTISLLLERYGYEVLDIRSVGFYRSWLQVFHSLFFQRWKMPRLYRLAERILPTGAGFSVNLFDIMQIVAQKR